MNFLQLCQFVHRNLGVGGEYVGTTPMDVYAPFGPLAEIVACVNDAYTDVQLQEPDWLFRASPGVFTCTSGTYVYTKAAIQTQITDYERLFPYSNGDSRFIVTVDTGSQVSARVYVIPWVRFGGTADFGTYPLGAPTALTILPNESIQIKPSPSNSTTTLRFFYTRTLNTLTLGTDTPILPSEWHTVIGWLAVRKWLAMKGMDPAKISSADAEYQHVMAALREMQANVPMPVLEPPTRKEPA